PLRGEIGTTEPRSRQRSCNFGIKAVEIICRVPTRGLSCRGRYQDLTPRYKNSVAVKLSGWFGAVPNSATSYSLGGLSPLERSMSSIDSRNLILPSPV